MKLKIAKQQSSDSILKMLNELFPLHRTLVSDGFKQSLDILNRYLPINISEIPSGSHVYDWIVPNSWNVVEAYITDLAGNKLVDFSDCNLHLSSYSQSFSGKITHDELIEHLNFREDLPEAIPYNFHYYKKNWSFNISYNEFVKKFNHAEYFVKIDINEYSDFLRIGEVFLPGKSKEEILVTTYMCHPSMVNDNLSGVVVALELFNYLSKMEDRQYSYRLIIVPETIGAIAYLANNENRLSNIKGGFTVHCCGDSGRINYKKSYSGTTYIDQVVNYTFSHFLKSNDFGVLDFWPGGSDERQFNSAGVRLPMGALTRTPAAEFLEYHTSLDNLSLIKIEDLLDTLEKLFLIVNVMEYDILYINNYKGEPCFSRHNISYPNFKDALAKSSAYNVKILANEVDGTNTLLSIAQKWNLNIFHLFEIAKSFEQENLFKKI